MKLNSTENEEYLGTSVVGHHDRTGAGDTILMTTLSHGRMMDETTATTTRIIRGGGGGSSNGVGETTTTTSSGEMIDHEEIFFVELNSREMPIDCPEGYEAPVAVKSRPSMMIALPSLSSSVNNNTNAQNHDGGSANTSTSTSTTHGNTKNSIIKPLLSMLLKSGIKMSNTNNNTSQQQQSKSTNQQQQQQQKSTSVSTTTSSASSSSSSSPHTTIELATLDTIERSRRHVVVVNPSNHTPAALTVDHRGEVNTCFVMDSSAEEKSPAAASTRSHVVFSSSNSSSNSTTATSLVPHSNDQPMSANCNTGTVQQQPLLLSSPSSTSSASLIKSEFINNLNGVTPNSNNEMSSNTVYTVVTTSKNNSGKAAPVSIVEFNQNIVIKNVEMGGSGQNSGNNLVVMTSSPGSVSNSGQQKLIASPGGATTEIADLDLERMLNVATSVNAAAVSSSSNNSGGLQERIVMSKKMVVEKGFKQNIEVNFFFNFY